jgi:hypothetical protein
MPNYTELVDLFLTFLLPEHATEVGRFFENFVFNNMSNLLQKLNFYFNKQPQHMRKIFTCLNELSNDPEITLERLKTKFQPLLKGNQLLIDWFDQLFEKPPASLNAEFECVYIKKSLSDSENSIDSYYEEIHSKDLVDGDNVDELNSCGVRYKNGKIMYQGILLPGKISFLAHDSVSVPPKEKRDPKSLCVHQLRKHVKFDDTKAIKESEKPESSSKKSAKKAVKKHKLCDAQTLHAHAVRLNSVHAQNQRELTEILIRRRKLAMSKEEQFLPRKTSHHRPRLEIQCRLPAAHHQRLSRPLRSCAIWLTTMSSRLRKEKPLTAKTRLLELTRRKRLKRRTTQQRL